MNISNTEIKRWGIIVIQSLKSNDIKTGSNLYNDILQYKIYCRKESFSCFYDVNSLQEFRLVIKDIEDSLIEGDILTLHIETHGCDKGIGLNNGDIIEWKEFYDLIRPINIKIGHLLLVIMAMCTSIAMISSINPAERAPYRAFVCTTRDISAKEIEVGFEAFYENYYNLLDIMKALKAIQEKVKDENGHSPFQIFTAESVFDETFNMNRSVDVLVNEQLQRLGVQKSEKEKQHLADIVRKSLIDLHDRYYDYYNFRDKY